MKRPILISGICYLIGTIIGIINENVKMISITISIVVLIVICIGNIKKEIKIALCFMIIASLNYTYSYNKAMSSIDKLNNRTVSIEAVVKEKDEKNNYINIKISTTKIEEEKINISAILKIYDQNIYIGDTIKATVKFSKIKNSKNFDSINYYKSQNIFLNASLMNIEVIKTNNGIIKYLNKIRERIKENNLSLLPNITGDFVNAITLGFKDDLSDDIKNIFITTGTSHIFALSGLHISIISIFIFYLLKYFKLGKYANIITIICLSLYYLMINNSLSMLRAVIMFSMFLIADILNRYNDSLSSLSLAFILISFSNPFSIFSIGFLLSFLSVLGIIISSFKMDFIDSYVKNTLLNNICKSIYISIFINIFTLPVQSIYFGKLNVISPIFNLFVLFIFSPILISSFILCLSSLLSLSFISHIFAIVIQSVYFYFTFFI